MIYKIFHIHLSLVCKVCIGKENVQRKGKGYKNLNISRTKSAF